MATTDSERSLTTSLSFAIPTSLAFFERLTWEQTPWTTENLSQSTAEQISAYLPERLSTQLTPTALQHAFCLGVTYASLKNQPKHTYPHLFIVFPHLNHDITRDADFLAIWHDQIVKPAFDEAWRESGLVKIQGKERFETYPNGSYGKGTYTECDAVPSAIVLKRLAEGNMQSMHAVWPYSEENRPKFEGLRAHIFDQAWDSMMGMLKCHPALSEFQEPVLLAVWGFKATAGEGVNEDIMVELMRKQWGPYMDEHFMRPGSFTVRFDDREGSPAESHEAS